MYLFDFFLLGLGLLIPTNASCPTVFQGMKYSSIKIFLRLLAHQYHGHSHMRWKVILFRSRSIAECLLSSTRDTVQNTTG